jgi:hypothetical protein
MPIHSLPFIGIISSARAFRPSTLLLWQTPRSKKSIASQVVGGDQTSGAFRSEFTLSVDRRSTQKGMSFPSGLLIQNQIEGQSGWPEAAKTHFFRSYRF